MSAGTIACLSVLGVLVVGFAAFIALSALAFKKFNAATMGAEARNTLRQVARAQMETFKTTGKLCSAAPPVPAHVPKKATHPPSKTPGEDFLRGSSTDGWVCLEIEITDPIRYQYEMRVGGGYKAPARGGPDAGPGGFEISAEGDLDGDGKTSLFAQIGRLDAATNTLVIEDKVFVADEGE